VKAHTRIETWNETSHTSREQVTWHRGGGREKKKNIIVFTSYSFKNINVVQFRQFDYLCRADWPYLRTCWAYLIRWNVSFGMISQLCRVNYLIDLSGRSATQGPSTDLSVCARSQAESFEISSRTWIYFHNQTSWSRNWNNAPRPRRYHRAPSSCLCEQGTERVRV
jgi:hypothetical protein